MSSSRQQQATDSFFFRHSSRRSPGGRGTVSSNRNEELTADGSSGTARSSWSTATVRRPVSFASSRRSVPSGIACPSPPTIRRWPGVSDAIEAQNAVGLTGIHQMDGGHDTIEAFRALSEAGRLSLRIRLHQWVDPSAGPDELAEIITPTGPTWTANSVKLMLDGVIDTGTAWLKEPDTHGRQRPDVAGPGEVPPHRPTVPRRGVPHRHPCHRRPGGPRSPRRVHGRGWERRATPGRAHRDGSSRAGLPVPTRQGPRVDPAHARPVAQRRHDRSVVGAARRPALRPRDALRRHQLDGSERRARLRLAGRALRPPPGLLRRSVATRRTSPTTARSA